MKKKQMKKKLSLNKVTVAHLGRDEMSEAMGGCTITEILSYLTICDDCNNETDACIKKDPTNYQCRFWN